MNLNCRSCHTSIPRKRGGNHKQTWRPHKELCFDWSAGLSTGVFLSIRANVRPPSQWILWTDGSVPFPFGKGGSAVLANCSLCATEATLSFSAGPVCSSFSTEACAILHALCWSWQHQQICHFFYLLLSDSRSVLSSVFPFTSNSLADLAGTVFSLLLFYQATMGRRTLVSPGEQCS